MDYEVVNNAITYNSTNADVTLPSSLYLSSKPAFFGSMPWPPFNPTNTSAAAISMTNLPAGYRSVYGVAPPSGSTTNPPSITSQPQSMWAATNTVATFSVSATGSGALAYQWHWFGTNVASATASSWTTPAVTMGMSNSVVSVGITNAYGGLVSSSAYLWVSNIIPVAPTITVQPSSQRVMTNAAATFAVAAAGSGTLVYQWSLAGTNVPGATQSSWSVTGPTPAQVNNVWVGITNSYGGLQSSTVQLITTNGVTQAAVTNGFYPIKANGRYFVDTNGGPFLMIGDSPHAILANVGYADAAAYLVNRGSNGFNSIWVELMPDSYVGGYGGDGTYAAMTSGYCRDFFGNNPFTGTLSGGFYNLTTPNAAYWSHVDWLLATAATNGIQACLTPLDEAGLWDTAQANGSNNCYTFGAFLGNRYKNTPNIFWQLGNDYDERTTAANNALILGIAAGIQSVDTNHLLTCQLGDSVWFSSSTCDLAQWRSVVNVNGSYPYTPTYGECLRAWNQSTKPVVMLEANYDSENNTGAQTGTPYCLRLQEYWSLLSGSVGGHMYGNHYWAFQSGWQSALNITSEGQLMLFKAFTLGRKGWQNLVPDQTHKLVTSGYGTFSTNTYQLDNNTYATAALTPDGTLGIVYTPVIANSLVVALTNFSGSVTSRWYDPSAGTFSAITGSPFANTGTHSFTTPGNNAAGDGDWVLLLESTGSGGEQVKPSAPSALPKYSTTPQPGTAPLAVQFECLVANATNWVFNFGDGKSSTNINPIYTYNAPGTYTFTLRVMGADGATAYYTNRITVTN